MCWTCLQQTRNNDIRVIATDEKPFVLFCNRKKEMLYISRYFQVEPIKLQMYRAWGGGGGKTIGGKFRISQK